MPIGDVPKDCGGASKHCTLRQYPLWGLPGAQRLFFVVLCTVSPVLRRVQARDRQKIGWDGGVLLYMNFHLAQLMGLVPVRIAGMVVQLFKWQILFLPWNLILFSVSTVAGVLLRFLVLTGASLPSGYADKDTVCFWCPAFFWFGLWLLDRHPIVTICSAVQQQRFLFVHRLKDYSYACSKYALNVCIVERTDLKWCIRVDNWHLTLFSSSILYAAGENAECC